MVEVLRSIVHKELLDGLRDRRALLTLFFMPVFFLILLVGMVLFIVNVQQKSESFRLPVHGLEHAQPLMAWLWEEGVEVLPVSADPVELVRSQREDFVLVIPPDLPERFQDFEPASLELVYDRSRSNLQGQVNRIKMLIQQWSGRVGSLRLMARGVSPQLAQPITVQDVDVANDQKLASRVFAIIPIMLVMTIFTSSIGLSVDMMAGEREKHSLEPLLLNPVSRELILMGKWLAAILCTAAVFVLTCVALYFVVPALPLEKLGLQYEVGGRQLMLSSLAALPLVCLATITQLLLSIFAKSFKEAQSYISLLVMLPIALAYYILFTDVNGAWQVWVPILGPLTLMENIFMGESSGAQQWGIAVGVSFLSALLIAALLARQLGRERIIYG
ncbi:ABC transporter permease [Gilvimarinus sp. F26214L]|uniref:ABC transporter permease n=1 Tax=Gilvimarinus sp. DZF01 TaxID=3461371 RepID=UPI00404602F4